MTKDLFFGLGSMTKAEEVVILELETKVRASLEKLRADCDRLKALYFEALGGSESVTHVSKHLENLCANFGRKIVNQARIRAQSSYSGEFSLYSATFRLKGIYYSISHLTNLVTCPQKRIPFVIQEGDRVGGRRVVDAIVVSAVILLSFVYLYLIGFIDRGGSNAGSSGSLDFRDIYISIVLFQAAYIWIKFRDVIPRGAVYYRPNSNKFEPRIKFPVIRGVGGKSKRIPLGLYDTFTEGEVAYQIAAFYCKKPKHTGRLDLGGGAYFPIPTLSMGPNLSYEEKVKQVGAQVLKVYAQFEEQKASRNLPPSIPGRQSSPIQQLRNSGMDSVMPGQGSELDPNTHNGVDFNNQGCLLLLHTQTQHELLDAYKQIERLKSQVSHTEFKNREWEVKFSDLDMKYSELESKFLELEQKSSELERENQLLNHQIEQSQLPTLHEEQEFDVNRFLCMGNEESLAR